MTIMCGRPRTAVVGFLGVEFTATSGRYGLAGSASDLVATEDCYIKFGDQTVVATVNDTYFEAGSEAFNHPVGATHIAAIRVSTDGELLVTARGTEVAYGTPQAAEFAGSHGLQTTLATGAQARPCALALWLYLPATAVQNTAMSVSDAIYTQSFNHLPRGDGTDWDLRVSEVGSGSSNVTSSQTMASSVWTAAIARFESATLRTAWLNGVGADSLVNIITGPIGADRLTIGARIDLSDDITADIARAVLIDGVITDAQSIQFEAGEWPQAIWGTSVVAHYEFLTTGELVDLSGNYSTLAALGTEPTYSTLPAGLLATLDYPDKLDGSVSEEYPDNNATASAALPSGEGYVRVRTPYAIWLLVGASPTATRGAGNEVAVPAGTSLQVVGSAANFSVINQTTGEFGSVQISGLTT